MIISSQFNRFMHGVVLRELGALRYLQIREHKLALRPFYLTHDTLKQLLKVLDFDYPREKGGKPFSYKKLTAHDMLAHIAFIELVMAENGFEPKYLQEFKEEIKNV